MKSLLKWVGGKTQLLDTLFENFPKEINNYHEIFIGGGSVLISLLSDTDIIIKGTINAYDANEILIYMYKNIQSSPNEILNNILPLIAEYQTCNNTNDDINRVPKDKNEAKICKENYYYWIRKIYNSLSDQDKRNPIGSALFIFLNKTCFRGLYRVGPNGFNVPYGHYNNPEIINKDHLYNIHNLIKNVNFECCDFSHSLSKNFQKDDFIYLDPPYAPESSTSFVSYTENGFNIEHHNKLFNIIKSLNVKCIMSNSYVPLVVDNFNTADYTILSVVVKRSINSKKPNAKTKEVIIKNY
jgi:DNA adenine methylase